MVIEKVKFISILVLVFTELLYGALIVLPSSSIIIALMFGLNIALILISWKINGIDLITFLILCLNLLVVPITIQYFTGESYGVLALNKTPIHIDKVLNYNFLFCSIIIICSVIFNFKKVETYISQINWQYFSKYNIWFNNAIAIIFTIVAFPRLTMQVAAGERFNMLLPGNAWNQLAIVGLLFNYRFLKDRLSVKLTYTFVIAWFLLNGERADVTGLVLGLIVFKFVSSSKKISRRMAIKLIILTILFAVAMNMIVMIRNGNFSFGKSFSTLFTTATTADVGYLYNASIDFYNNFGQLNGKLNWNLLKSAVPFTSSYGFGDVIKYPFYFNPGGEPYIAQHLLDGGIIGLIIGAIVDTAGFRTIIQFKNSFFKIEYLAILCLIPRIVWYGRSYALSTILFLVPAMYLANHLIYKWLKVAGIHMRNISKSSIN